MIWSSKFSPNWRQNSTFKRLPFDRGCRWFSDAPAKSFFFGLPGNPVSTYVTFHVFVRPTIHALSGAGFLRPLFLRARLASSVSRKPELTTFVPAWVDSEEGVPTVNPVKWQGSGDLVGLAAANSFLVVHPERAHLETGEWVDVMPLNH